MSKATTAQPSFGTMTATRIPCKLSTRTPRLFEAHRDCRRLQLLGRWSSYHQDNEPVFTQSSRPSGADNIGQSGGFAALEWIDWFNHRRLLAPIGSTPPAEAEQKLLATIDKQPTAAFLTPNGLREIRYGSGPPDQQLPPQRRVGPVRHIRCLVDDDCQIRLDCPLRTGTAPDYRQNLDPCTGDAAPSCAYL